MTAEPTTPPPATGGVAARFGFVRCAADRKIAGVASAFGRATGTDALLWRVLLAVLTVFAGAGLVVYLVCWLVFPAEGDQTSPVESLVTSKSSSMSIVVTLLLALGAVLLFVIAVAGVGWRPFLVFALLTGLVAMLTRRRRSEPPDAAAPNPKASTTPSAEPRADAYTVPFAPHGPYANRTLEYPAASPNPPAQSAPAVTADKPPGPPRPPGPPSPLGRVTFCLILIGLSVVAVLGMLDVIAIDLGLVLAVSLLTCGAALLVGAWWGRGRGLIALGLVLMLGVAAVSLSGGLRPVVPFQSQLSEPTSVDTIPEELSTIAGDTRLDLTRVAFSDADTVTVRVNVWAGAARITVPADVDVVYRLDYGHSSVEIDGERISDVEPRGCDDCEALGEDGRGGGTLIVTGSVESGQLEVRR